MDKRDFYICTDIVRFVISASPAQALSIRLLLIPAQWIALVLVSALFGIGHYYQGSAGMFTTGCDGFMIGAAYLLARRNLWVAVFAHGFVDTIAFTLVLLGLAD